MFARLSPRATRTRCPGWQRQVPEKGVGMSIRTPSNAPAGQECGPPSEPPYPWQLFVGMLLAILVVGAVLALLLGVNPLTCQKMASGAEPTQIATAPGVMAPA